MIRESRGLSDFADVVAEAETFLRMPQSWHEPERADRRRAPASINPVINARRLFAASQALPGTIVETYLRNRGITALHESGSLRFHPRCYYRPDPHSPVQPRPAMVAAVNDLNGCIMGVNRTWLTPNGSGKAVIATPRRAMGHLIGHAVRFGSTDDVMAAGEGIETILSLPCALPALPMAAALSAAHLPAITFAPGLRRLYIVRDNDPAGDRARDSLVSRAASAGIEVIVLSPALGDFNEDLRAFGVEAVRAGVRAQIAPEDVGRSWCCARNLGRGGAGVLSPCA